MLRSMTAYGRAILSYSFGRLLVEVQSVNKRYLDVTVFLPRELAHFETELRSWVKAAVERGQVRITVRAAFEKEIPLQPIANLPLACQLRCVWEEISKAVDVQLTDDALLQVLLQQGGELVRFEQTQADEEKYRGCLKEAVEMALKEHALMQKKEGAALYEDLRMRIALLAHLLEKVDGLKEQAVQHYRSQLINRLKEAAAEEQIATQQRALQEAAFFAEKVDIAEEITRMRSHLKQMQDVMMTGNRSVGKTLDFIAQELHRETNTIASKSHDPVISELVIEMKTEIERIREQVQNVE